jgi:hypothetical protein
LEYLLLDEALSEGSIEIEEVDKEGSVPELMVINNFPQMILILEGGEEEELIDGVFFLCTMRKRLAEFKKNRTQAPKRTIIK